MPARDGEVVVEVVGLHVDDDLVARDRPPSPRPARSPRRRRRCTCRPTACPSPVVVVVARGEHAEHQRGTAEAAEELAPADAEPARVMLGLDTGAADRLALDRAERERPELTVRAGPELDRQLGVRIPPVHAATLGRRGSADSRACRT